MEDYEVLGVLPGASQEVIRAAYKRRALEVHPDRGGSDEAFRKVQDAYEQLASPQQRAARDVDRSCDRFGLRELLSMPSAAWPAYISEASAALLEASIAKLESKSIQI